MGEVAKRLFCARSSWCLVNVSPAVLTDRRTLAETANTMGTPLAPWQPANQSANPYRYTDWRKKGSRRQDGNHRSRVEVRWIPVGVTLNQGPSTVGACVAT